MKSRDHSDTKLILSDSFEVSIFLTELSTPHAVLVRSREFSAKDVPDSRTGTKDVPMMVHEDDDDGDVDVQLVRQESNDSGADQGVKLEDLPMAPESDEELPSISTVGNSKDDAVSISSHGDGNENDDDAPKKKLHLKTSYDGFSIYGRILCLVVKRRDQRTTVTSSIVGQQKTNAPPNDSDALQGKTQDQMTGSVQNHMRSTNQEPEGILEGWMRSTQVSNDNHGITGSSGDVDSD